MLFVFDLGIYCHSEFYRVKKAHWSFQSQSTIGRDKHRSLSEEKNDFLKKGSLLLTFDSYHSVSCCHLGFSSIRTVFARCGFCCPKLSLINFFMQFHSSTPKVGGIHFLLTVASDINDRWIQIQYAWRMVSYATVNFTVVIYVNTRAIHW